MQGGGHILQELLAPRAGLPEALYLRVGSAAGPASLPGGWVLGGEAGLRGLPEGGLALEAGGVLSTDTFFGAFHRAWWRAWTEVDSLALAVRLEGRAELRLYEDAGLGESEPRLLVRQRLEGGAALIPVAAAAAGPSRLYVELEALAPCRLLRLDHVTDRAPLRQATLSVGLVTFNQEAAFARTLARLVRLAEARPEIRALHVVNQGEPFAAPELAALLAAPVVRAVAQANLGGAGGFARGMAAAMADPEPASHHLLMDDDIDLDERLILRALRFLDHAGDRVAVGAGMLDGLRPTVMHEAGATHRQDNVIAPHCHNVDLGRADEQHHFNAPVPSDFTAWWFTILPMAGMRKAGLPAPLFLRGDDFEYAERLTAAGVASIGLPGIAVWHAPFHAKPLGWQAYYDLRNRLVFAALHPERVRQLSLAHVVGLVTTAALTHAYGVAEARLRALADFLDGPGAVWGRDATALQAEVLALARAGAPEPVAGMEGRSPSPAPPRPERMGRLALSQLGALLRTGLGPLDLASDPVLRDDDVHAASAAGRAYVQTNLLRSYHLRFVPRRGRLWRLMLRAAAVAVRFRLRRGAAAADWRAAAPEAVSSARWAETFAAAARPAPVALRPLQPVEAP